MLELRIHQQEPIRDFSTILILPILRLQDVEKRHRLFWLLTRLQFFVFLHDGVALLHFRLVGGNLIRSEWLPSKTLEQWLHISRRKVQLSQTNILQGPIRLKNLLETFSYNSWCELVM